LSLGSLIRSLGPNNRSFIGGFVRHFGSGRIYHPAFSQVFAVREATGFVIKDPDNESWDEVTRLLDDRPWDVYRVQYRLDHVDRIGFYAPTIENHLWFVTVGTFSSSANGFEVSEPLIRGAFVSWAERDRQLMPALGAQLKAVGFAEERAVIPIGYLHNTLAASALLLFFYSLSWVPRAPAYLAATRAQRRLALGRCPYCNYSIVGLPEPVCPECGRGWNVTAEDDPAPGVEQAITPRSP